MDTYNGVYLKVRKALLNSGFIENPEMEAKFIVAHGMGKTREQLLAMSNIYATDIRVRQRIDELLQRRLKGEPLAYILGEWEFYGMDIYVNNHVLIPRIDTELLASVAIKLANVKVWKTRILDLCTGSGCVGLAIAKHASSASVVLADYSEDVLAVCRQNALRCGVTRNTTTIEVDALDSPPELLGGFDIIACNPPYIPTADIAELDSSITDYEPIKALDGGETGLDFFHSVASKWTRVIKQGGHLAFECGIGQSDDVCYIMKQNGFVNISVQKDTLGIERVVSGMMSDKEIKVKSII